MSKPFNALERDCTPERCTCMQRARAIRRGVLLSMEMIRKNMMWPEERHTDKSVPPLSSVLDALCRNTGPCNLELTTYAQYNHAIRWLLKKERERAETSAREA